MVPDRDSRRDEGVTEEMKKRGHNDADHGGRKGQKYRRTGVPNPTFAGLPAKPSFGRSQTSGCDANRTTGDKRGKPKQTGHQETHMELFPGMMVNLPQDNPVTAPPPAPSNSPPSAEVLQLFSSILGTLQSQKEQQQGYSQQHPPQQHYAPPYNNQYAPHYTPEYSQPFQQQNCNPPYNQAYQQDHSGYGQGGAYGAYPSPLPQQQANPNAALVSMFTSFIQSQAQTNGPSGVAGYANQHREHKAPGTEKETFSENAAIPEKPQLPAKKNANTSKKTPRKEAVAVEEGGAGDDGDALTDEEAEWNKSVAIQGTNIIFENDEDIQKWIEERKKNWPTNKRVEEKKEELEKAKKIIENFTSKKQNQPREESQGTPKSRVCSFWLKNRRCKNGKNCKFSHEVTDKTQGRGTGRNQTQSKSPFTKSLPNHKMKLVHGIPTQIPQRFTPLSNKGKSLHSLLIEGEQFKEENMKLINLFEKMVRFGIIKQDWESVKRSLKIDDDSLNLN